MVTCEQLIRSSNILITTKEVISASSVTPYWAIKFTNRLSAVVTSARSNDLLIAYVPTRTPAGNSSSSSLFVQIKIHDAKRAHDKTWTGQQGGKNHTYCCPWIEKEKKTQNLHNTLQLNTMGKKYNSNKNNNGSVSQGPGSLKGQPY